MESLNIVLAAVVLLLFSIVKAPRWLEDRKIPEPEIRITCPLI